MFTEEVSNQSIDSRRSRRKSRDREVVSGRDLLAQIVLGQFGFGLLAFGLELTVLRVAFVEG
jgi:hypothetical protein